MVFLVKCHSYDQNDPWSITITYIILCCIIYNYRIGGLNTFNMAILIIYYSYDQMHIHKASMLLNQSMIQIVLTLALLAKLLWRLTISHVISVIYWSYDKNSQYIYNTTANKLPKIWRSQSYIIHMTRCTIHIHHQVKCQ